MQITVTLDKSINAVKNFVKFGTQTNKKKLDKGMRFFREILFWIALFLLVVFWGFGHFVLGH